MSEMVERVAKAIQLESGDELIFRDAEALARAAIAAMREPTEEQFQGEWWDNINKGPPSRRAHLIWQSMIDAALK